MSRNAIENLCISNIWAFLWFEVSLAIWNISKPASVRFCLSACHRPMTRRKINLPWRRQHLHLRIFLLFGIFCGTWLIKDILVGECFPNHFFPFSEFVVRHAVDLVFLYFNRLLNFATSFSKSVAENINIDKDCWLTYNGT